MARPRAHANLQSALPYVILAVICSGAIAVTTTRGNDNSTASFLTGSGGTENASGSIAEQLRSIEQRAAELEWEARVARTQTFRKDIIETWNTLLAIQNQTQNNLERRAEHRAACAEELRSASKFTKLPISLRCTKADLQLEIELLRKEKERITVLPGVTEDTRSLALTRLDLLMDALQTIVTAIESDVFQAVEELKEAKQNLRITYREPFWLLQLKLQAEKLQAWNASLMTRVAIVAEEQQVPDPTTTGVLLEAMMCLQQEEELLEDAGAAQNLAEAQQRIDGAQETMQICLAHLAEALELHGSSSQPAEETTGDSETGTTIYLNRTLQRRLGEEYRIQE